MSLAALINDDNITQPIITATVELPPREPVQEHRKLIQIKREGRRRKKADDDEDEVNDGENNINININIIGAGPGGNADEPENNIGVLWRIVAGLGWRNKSDGPPPNNAAAALVRGLSNAEHEVFVREYNESVGATIVVLTGIFGANGITDSGTKLKIASHAVALGREQYRSFMEDITLFEFIIMADEAQSFDAAIRPLLRRG